MKLLFVTQYFPPETGAPQTRLFELATRLRRRGHEMTVVTALPNYPAGRIYPNYRGKLVMEEEINGVRVLRSWIVPSISSRSLARVASYASFAASSLVWGGLKIGRQDVTLIESPPLFIIPTGLMLARRARSRVVLNVSDIWPDTVVRMGRKVGRASLQAMYRLERFGYQRSDLVTLTTPTAAEQIRERFPSVDTAVISNGVDTGRFRPSLRDEQLRRSMGAGPGTFLAGYCGLHGLAQGLEAVVQAASRLRHREDVRFVLIGDGPTKADLQRQARSLDLERLIFLDRRPAKEMPAVVASLDASLVPLSARLPGTMPSKVYEALASGVPVVVSRGCEAEYLIEGSDTGETFEPLDGRGLGAAVERLASKDDGARAEMSRRCRSTAKRFDRDTIAEHAEDVFRSVLEGGHIPALAGADEARVHERADTHA